MPKAKLRVSIPEATWIHDVSVDHPTVTFRVSAVLSERERGIALLELETADPVPVLTAVERRADVTDLELLWKRGGTTGVQVEATDLPLLAPLVDAGIPLRTPFEVVEGVATWEVTTSSKRLSALGTRLEEAGVKFETEYVREEATGEDDHLLTDRQRDVLVAAAEQGYYDTPRRTTLTAVSESLGISKATGSDILHRAEGHVVEWFIDEHLAGGGGGDSRT
jgi:hypothetical protein